MTRYLCSLRGWLDWVIERFGLLFVDFLSKIYFRPNVLKIQEDESFPTQPNPPHTLTHTPPSPPPSLSLFPIPPPLAIYLTRRHRLGRFRAGFLRYLR